MCCLRALQQKTPSSKDGSASCRKAAFEFSVYLHNGLVQKVVRTGGKDFVHPITSNIRLPVENSLEECLPGTVLAAMLPFSSIDEFEESSAFQPNAWQEWCDVFYTV